MNADYFFKFFDRIVVINLRSRPERLANFKGYLKNVNWSLRAVDVFEAIHGDSVGVHDNWKTGGGSYGCMLSHTRVLERAIMDKVDRILVMEDDAYFPDPENFTHMLQRFLTDVPSDWDCLMLGGQTVKREKWQRGPQLVSNSIARHDGCERTHAYALQGNAIKSLYRKWIHADCHIDWIMGPFMGKNFKVYSPVPFLVGQDGGQSDISGRKNGKQSWSGGNPSLPIILLTASREKYDALNGSLFHGGYTRNAQGVDVGLLSIIADNNEFETKSRRLLEWIEMISGEALAIGPECLCTIWFPGVDRDFIQSVLGNRLIEITIP